MGPRWIEKRAAKPPAPKEPEELRRAFAALEEHRAAKVDAAKVAKAPVPKRPWLARQPVDYPASPSVEAELARLAAQSPSNWHSPLRAELVARGLVRVLIAEDGRWGGDAITEAGLALLRGAG